jgi:hypothetical protein
MSNPNDPETYATPTKVLRRMSRFPLGQGHRPTHTQDLRRSHATHVMAARVLGVRLSAHLPHHTPASGHCAKTYAPSLCSGTDHQPKGRRKLFHSCSR